MKRIEGLVLLALGLSWLILSVLNFTITGTVIDTAFALEAGETYGPWEKGTEYWTRGLPVLKINDGSSGLGQKSNHRVFWL